MVIGVYNYMGVEFVEVVVFFSGCGWVYLFVDVVGLVCLLFDIDVVLVEVVVFGVLLWVGLVFGY